MTQGSALTPTLTPLRDHFGSSITTARRSCSATSTLSTSGRISTCSILESVRMRSESPASLCDSSMMTSRYSARSSGVRSSSRSSWAKPHSELMGVLNSWEKSPMKLSRIISVLASSAAAVLKLSTNSSASRRRSVPRGRSSLKSKFPRASSASAAVNTRSGVASVRLMPTATIRAIRTLPQNITAKTLLRLVRRSKVITPASTSADPTIPTTVQTSAMTAMMASASSPTRPAVRALESVPWRWSPCPSVLLARVM